MTSIVRTTADDKWETQLRKGCLELAILASLWEGRLYGLEILRVLKENSGLVINEGTIYPLLNRLKVEGLVNAEWVEADTGHPRKYYRLTTDGRRRARAMASAWARLTGNLQKLLKSMSPERGNEDEHHIIE